MFISVLRKHFCFNQEKDNLLSRLLLLAMYENISLAENFSEAIKCLLVKDQIKFSGNLKSFDRIFVLTGHLFLPGA